MLSRTANSIYWMGRYLERADNVARFIYVNTHLILDLGWECDPLLWEPLVYASGDDQDFTNRYTSKNAKDVIYFLTFDNKNENSIVSCIQKARENARTVREIISTEMWETINTLYHLVEKQSKKKNIDETQNLLKKIRDTSHLLIGLGEDSISHDEGWHFLRMGRLLERADKTARILDVKYFLLLFNHDTMDSPYDTVEWGAVLKSVNGFQMYRKQFHRTQCRNVVQFLILDPDFPRSIRYCVNTAARSLKKITEILNVSVPVEKEMRILQVMLEQIKIENILQQGFHEFIDMFQYNLNVVDQTLHHSFFNTTLKQAEPSKGKHIF